MTYFQQVSVEVSVKDHHGPLVLTHPQKHMLWVHLCSYSSTKTYVVGTHLKCLTEVFLIGT